MKPKKNSPTEPAPRAGRAWAFRMLPRDEDNLRVLMEWLNSQDFTVSPIKLSGTLRWALHYLAQRVKKGEQL